MSTAVIAPNAAVRARQSAPRLRLTTRGRVVLMTLAATPLVIAALLISLNSGGAAATLESNENAFVYVDVAAGQSLWNIAEQHAPGHDPREVVAQLIEVNQMSSADIFAGQELAIPASFSN
ncbi:LysM peptidoglycan-binding domain-containing protein [Salinibacterium sp. NSLL150]|nr:MULTISPECIES: LysM peptidoglycan-binding domain-containing protein [unclassified Salinibacterium]MBH0025333.1 LysM peptidoglycan-binding domain-containing protein [Salinibacterium sp. SWN248]MBH0084399.1 LysM peptidoglycan-binding domain-containing protein [Salinibacterium sp. SWN167]MBH0117939.1 LysM peptidoglycan-binding domain-containing protein [Salinibacterium sp. NG253]MBH0055306.1 LysM peptidoglycan-binding domain-containing protein [Salinibacterium sp. SWN139]MBH0100062.1 LysM pepti